jgi:hypothetical protein
MFLMFKRHDNFNPTAAILQIYVKFARAGVGSAASVFILPMVAVSVLLILRRMLEVVDGRYIRFSDWY